MPAAAQPVNGQSTALGMMIRKVLVEQVVPERAVAIVRDAMGYLTEIPYAVQQGRARMPRSGDYWYVDRSMGPWIFSAYIAKDDTDIATFTEKQNFTSGITVPDGQQINMGASFSNAAIAVLRANPADASFASAQVGDSLSRYVVRVDGQLQWGPGGAGARDTNLYRSAADTLKTDDSLIVTGNLTAGTVTITGGTVPVWYDTATDQISTSTTYAAGTTECGGSFIAPKSGIVNIHVTGRVQVSANTANCILSFEVRQTSSTGTVIRAADDESGVWTGTTDTIMATVLGKPLSGLTPGATYWMRTMYKVTGAITGTASYRRINVTPFT